MLFNFFCQNFAEGFGILKKFQREFRTEIRIEFRSKKHPFKTYFIFQDLYPIKLHDLKLSSKDNYELTKKVENPRQKPTEKAKIDYILVEYIIVMHCVLIKVSFHGVKSYWCDYIHFSTDHDESK